MDTYWTYPSAPPPARENFLAWICGVEDFCPDVSAKWLSCPLSSAKKDDELLGNEILSRGADTRQSKPPTNTATKRRKKESKASGRNCGQ
ncbi:hypothetical protein KM043_016952 [Ampulex compressa]|nr:hypothetical protein KM043_016952 [Ampulex compressa]